MLALEVTINVFVILGIIMVATAIGFFLRSAQLNSLRRKVVELEKEMLTNHASILELQKERALLEKRLKESQIPVIPMKSMEDMEIEAMENKKIRR